MANSSITLQTIVDYARTMPDIAPIIPVSGLSIQPSLTIANKVMTTMLAPGMPWKWNRFLPPVFYTNSLQQDYAGVGVVSLGWIEDSFAVDINNTQTPLPMWPMEVVRELPRTSWQWGRIGQICWLPNSQLTYGTWAANTTYTKIIGTTSNPGTALTQIQDSNGNLWVVTNNTNATVVTGATIPAFPASPVFPTYLSPSTVATTVTDNTVTWTAVNPSGQGYRVFPLPPNQGLYFEIHPIGQSRPVQFTALSQKLEPIPDDYAPYFQSGFVAYAYQHSKDRLVRDRFQTEFGIWVASMQESLSKQAREREQAGFYPAESLLQGGYVPYMGPANPYYPGGF